MVHRRGASRSINAVRRKARIRRAFARSIRAGCALCLAGLSLSNAPADNPPASAFDPVAVRIRLADVESGTPARDANYRLAKGLLRCRSPLDGSFDGLVAAATGVVGTDRFEHMLTDIVAVGNGDVTVAMIFRTRDRRGFDIVRQARASIDLASCNASNLSMFSA